MKKLLCLGFSALMMLFAVPNVRADEGETPEVNPTITLTPTADDAVNDGTVVTITVTGVPDGYVYNEVNFALAATKAEAEGLSNFDLMDNTYSDKNKPVITAAKPVLKVGFLVQGETYAQWHYAYGEYTIATGEIANPSITVNGMAYTGKMITATDKIQITPTDDDQATEIWYTLDGSTPAKDQGTKYTGEFSLSESKVVKAIAVNSENKTSAVVEAHFTVGEAVKPQVALYTQTNTPITSEYGKYVEFYVMTMMDDEPSMESMVYYTIDGTTTPDMEAYYVQDADGPIYYASGDPDGDPFPKIMLTGNSTTLKVVSYVMVEGENEPVASDVETFELTAKTVANPTLDKPAGEVESGAVVKVTNATDFAAVYYTTNGSIPSLDRTSEDVVFEYNDEDGIVINENVTVSVIAYNATAGEPGQARDWFGSDLVTRAYTVPAVEEPEEPVLTVTPASNGTTEGEGLEAVTTFNGVAKFKMSVTARPNHDSLYKISAALWTKADFNDYEHEVSPITVNSYDVTDTTTEFVDAYNGEYVVVFELQEFSKMAGEYQTLGVGIEINFTVTNNEEPIPPVDPELNVTAAGKNTTGADGKITFEGIAAFNMAATGELITSDSLGNYTITFELYTPLALDTMGPYITSYSYNAADTTDGVVKAELVGVYNGEYGAYIYITRINGRLPEELGGTSIKFAVTEYPEPEVVDPTFAVAAAGKNEMKENTVVFDGMAEFTMAVGEMSEGDSLQIAAVLYTKINFDTFGQPITTDYYAVDATKAEFNGVYNGEYAVRFELQRYSLMMRDFSEVTDTVIYFNVTNYEEIIDNYTVAIKAVGATMNADTAAYTGKVAFDILVGGLQADDDMSLVTTIFNKAQYEAEPQPGEDVALDTIAISTVKAADSVRFENAEIVKGEYVAVVELVRAGDREDIPVEFATLYFTVSEESVVENNTELAGVNVYPNPNNGTFNVAVPEKARIDIFGLNGAMVMSREANAGVETFSIDHSGIYFVRVMAGNKAAVKRVVVR